MTPVRWNTTKRKVKAEGLRRGVYRVPTSSDSTSTTTSVSSYMRRVAPSSRVGPRSWSTISRGVGWRGGDPYAPFWTRPFPTDSGGRFVVWTQPWKRERERQTRTHTYTYTFIYTSIYLFIYLSTWINSRLNWVFLKSLWSLVLHKFLWS